MSSNHRWASLRRTFAEIAKEGACRAYHQVILGPKAQTVERGQPKATRQLFARQSGIKFPAFPLRSERTVVLGEG
jgi:hypothetical protein